MPKRHSRSGRRESMQLERFARQRGCRGALLVVLACGAGTPAAADVGDELFKLVAADAMPHDRGGQSVAISGETAVAGAPGADGASQNVGAAYIFNAYTGVQRHKLTASDADTNDKLGWAVAVDSGRAIIGAIGDEDHTGSAYIFDATTGQQQAKLVAADGEGWDHFGWSVAIDGDYAVVGAKYDSDAGLHSGSAYVFDVSSGQQLFKLTASDAGARDEFGYAVALSGTIAIIGAWGGDDHGIDSGAAYVFDVTTGQELAKITASDASQGDNFGFAVAISGHRALVGAPYGNESFLHAGAAYLFDVADPANPVEVSKFKASDAVSGDLDVFGASVAIHKAAVVIGARFDDDHGAGSGSAYLFNAVSGQEQMKLTAFTAAAGDNFGTSVAISHNVAVSGAPYNDDAGTDAGAAYVVAGCRADFDGSGALDIFDFLAFMDAFAAQDPRADLNHDGLYTIMDFLEFQNQFAAGCR